MPSKKIGDAIQKEILSIAANSTTSGVPPTDALRATLKACGIGAFFYPIALNADGLLSFDTGTSTASWTLNMEQLLGMDEPIDSASDFFARVHAADQSTLNERLQSAIKSDLTEDDHEYRIVWPSGEVRWLLSRYLIGRDENQYPMHISGVCFDITSHKYSEVTLSQANKQLQQAQHYLHTALNSSGIAIYRHYFGTNAEVDSPEFANYQANTWNFNLAEIYGYPSGTEVTVEMMMRHIHPDDFAKVQDETRKMVEQGVFEYEIEYRIRRVDGDLRWLLLKILLEHDSNGALLFGTGAAVDITERKQAQDRIQYLATHDALTTLPNRIMFSTMLNHEIETAKRYSQKFAVLFIDLDRFKAINDALGHQAGDLLLQEIAQRLRDAVRASDVAARLSGDEFVVLMKNISAKQEAGILARKIITETMKPVTLHSQECRVTASIGISVFAEDADDEQSLMKYADVAMYQAKEEGKNNFQFYNPTSKSHTLERMTLENQLRSALENGELSLQYQAKLDLHTDRISGVEALLRWNNPQFGAISPTQLIPIAEETGLIVPIGRWVLKTACLQNVTWQAQGLPPVCIAVNLSPRQFLDERLLVYVEEALRESGMKPELLELEITEGTVMHHVEQAIQVLHAIKQLGIRIAIDDFGTGYSSLAQLKRFPIDILKVDRSFIRDVAHDAEDQAITEAIIAMGKSLSLTIVAEGVETPEQQNFVRSRACDEMQGFYFSKPVAAADFAELLLRHEVK